MFWQINTTYINSTLFIIYVVLECATTKCTYNFLLDKLFPAIEKL